MKHMILLLLPLGTLFAQYPFGQNAHWYSSFSGFNTGSGNGYAHRYHYKDTLINGETYQWMREFRRTILRTGPNPNDLIEWYNNIARNFLYITRNNVVFYYEMDLTNETVLYDFNAQVGDTVFFRDTIYSGGFFNCTQRAGYIVTAIGTKVIDGKNMTYWDIDSIYHGGEFLEGNRIYRHLGVLHGNGHTSLNNCQGIPSYHANFFRFRCFSNDSIHYQSPSWNSDCDFFYSISVEDFNARASWNIYPNPAEHTLHISGFPEHQTLSILIFDLQGKKVLELASSDYETQTLDIGYLPTGMYLLRLIDERGASVHLEKMMKQ